MRRLCECEATLAIWTARCAARWCERAGPYLHGGRGDAGGEARREDSSTRGESEHFFGDRWGEGRISYHKISQNDVAELVTEFGKQVKSCEAK